MPGTDIPSRLAKTASRPCWSLKVASFGSCSCVYRVDAFSSVCLDGIVGIPGREYASGYLASISVYKAHCSLQLSSSLNVVSRGYWMIAAKTSSLRGHGRIAQITLPQEAVSDFFKVTSTTGHGRLGRSIGRILNRYGFVLMFSIEPGSADTKRPVASN